ncbi:transposase [Lapidilactobacillus mulanensis]|uniref:Transposase n=2 Tax=Lactobacillaceae TaxID=33958 RepID=A0ABW4DMC5_9LACO|nr:MULTISPECIES: transposase [Lactobacillaceae]
MTPEEEIMALRKQVAELTEMVVYLTKKIYGQKSEQIDPNQLALLEGNDGVFITPEQPGQQSDARSSTGKEKAQKDTARNPKS